MVAPLQVVVVGGERGGQGVGELVDGERHLLGEGLGRASRQLQGAKPAGGIERADIDPVGRALGLGGGLLQLAAHGRAPAGAFAADDEHVVARPLHAGAEGKRLQRLCLPDRAVCRLRGRRWS